MALPNNTSTIDVQTGYAVPASTGEWSTLTSWDSWKSWNIAADEMTVLSEIFDRGSVGYFNLKTNSDLTGNVQYSVYVSSTGEFAGEETETIITPNTGNVGAFYGRYYAVAANVSDPSGAAQLRSLSIISTNSRFDIQFNDVDSTTLSVGDNSQLILPLPRTVSAVLNMSLTPHDPATNQAYYITSGNTGYVYDWYGNVNTTITANIGPSPTFNQYMLVKCAVGEPDIALIYKTTDGDSWTEIGPLANVGPYPGDASDWSYDSKYVAYTVSANVNNIRIFDRSVDSFTKVNDPNVWPSGPGRDIAFTNTSNDYLAVAHEGSPWVTIYNQSGGVFTKISDPATLPTEAFCCAWNSTDSYFAVGTEVSPYVMVYSHSGGTFTKLSDPATLPTASGINIAWDPSSNRFALGCGYIPNNTVKIYSVSGSTVTFVTDLTGLPDPAYVYCMAWSDDGTSLAVGYTSWPSVRPSEPYDFILYRVYGNTFVKAGGATIDQAWGVYDLEWGADGTQLYVAHRNSIDNGRGLTAFQYDASANSFTRITGFTSNAGNLYTASGSGSVFTNELYVNDITGFPSSGTIRVGTENMTYTSANVSSNRFEGITRAQTDASFGSSVAASHYVGDEVVLTSSIDFTQRYYETQTIGQAFVYVGSKDRTSPTVTVKDNTGTATSGTFDATITVMPEQYMDSTDLNTR